MKNFLTTSVLSIAIVGSTFAQQPKKILSPAATTENELVKIDYSQPSVRGRKIFGDGKDYLQPYGKIWRVGANAATTIEVKEDLIFAGKELPKGKYAIYAIPNTPEWTIIINGNADQFGTQYEANKDKDIFKIELKPQQAQKFQETLDIQAKKREIDIIWENTELDIPIKKK